MSKLNIVEKFNRFLKPEPYRTFRRQGITDDNNNLTPNGQLVFLAFLLEKNKDEFKSEVVDKIVEMYSPKKD